MSNDKKYQQTKEQCQSKIGEFVCEGCGGILEPIETVDNSNNATYWVGCVHCSSFRGGVKKIYWDIARKLVESGELLLYSHLHKCDYEKSPEKLSYYLDSQTAGLSPIIGRIYNMICPATPTGVEREQ